MPQSQVIARTEADILQSASVSSNNNRTWREILTSKSRISKHSLEALMRSLWEQVNYITTWREEGPILEYEEEISVVILLCPKEKMCGSSSYHTRCGSGTNLRSDVERQNWVSIDKYSFLKWHSFWRCRYARLSSLQDDLGAKSRHEMEQPRKICHADS